MTLDASGSADPDGSALTYEWDLNGDGTYEIDSGAVATQTKSWATPWQLHRQGRVTDADGASTVAYRGRQRRQRAACPVGGRQRRRATAGTP